MEKKLKENEICNCLFKNPSSHVGGGQSSANDMHDGLQQELVNPGQPPLSIFPQLQK